MKNLNKKPIFLFLAGTALLALSLALTSCSSSEEDLSDLIKGTWREVSIQAGSAPEHTYPETKTISGDTITTQPYMCLYQNKIYNAEMKTGVTNSSNDGLYKGDGWDNITYYVVGTKLIYVVGPNTIYADITLEGNNLTLVEPSGSGNSTRKFIRVSSPTVTEILSAKD
ncbi:hypothetical protein [Treponema parvum]|uniref:hypothetical protein n=1 Tax=Treponema parvum TaxID=138851 RepID=UPI001AEBBDC6|nr:hypothetical protein [Treponema parvum]QTQ15566.1 hypothetical protein HXT04_01940 [Treponema parvum]